MSIWVGNRDGGELVDKDSAAVSVLDHGFTVGDGVFETLRVAEGQPFALTRHLARLRASASAMGMPDPDDSVVREAVRDVIDFNDSPSMPVGRLRITYTAGRAPLGSDRGDAVPTLVVATAAPTVWPSTTTIATVPWTRNEKAATAGVKSTSYADNVVALAWAHDRGASEAVFANTQGELCEGTGTNVFVVVDGRVLTPPLTSGCLAGVTRDLVIEWFGAREVDLPIDVLHEADEVFVTSSTRNVHPVVRADHREWGGPGPISRDLQAAFDEFAAKRQDP